MKQTFIRGFQVDFPSHTHHYLFYGCETVSSALKDHDFGSCLGQHEVCNNRTQIPRVSLKKFKKLSMYPSDVGYPIGSEFGINYIMLEVHFAKNVQNTIEREIISSVDAKIITTDHRPKYLNGVLTFSAASFSIPPHTEDYSVFINCKPKINHSIHPYAYWVHTHELGNVVSAYKMVATVGNTTLVPVELARWTHKWNQPVLITSVDKKLQTIIHPGDNLAGACTYSNPSNQTVKWGSSFAKNEMCNVFLYFYVDSFKIGKSNELSLSCVNERLRRFRKFYPNNFNQLPKINPICHLYYKVRVWDCPFN